MRGQKFGRCEGIKKKMIISQKIFEVKANKMIITNIYPGMVYLFFKG